MSTSGLEPLRKPMLHHKNHAISLKIKPEILFMIQIPRTSNFSTYYQIKTTPIHETKQAIKIFSKGQLSFGIIIS
jgi:hypothetical protein